MLNIKVSNEQEQKDLQVQMLVVMDFIKSKFGNLTIPEIQEAFKMFVAREFSDIKVFRILDCVSIGEVLNAYKNYRNESLRVYAGQNKALNELKKEVTAEEKKKIRELFLKTLFDDLKQNKYSADAWLLFEEMETAGLIVLSKFDKELQYKIEEKKYLQSLQDAVMKHPHSTVCRSDLKTAMQLIGEKKRLSIVKNKCRSTAVSEYLNRFTDDFEKFKAILKND